MLIEHVKAIVLVYDDGHTERLDGKVTAQQFKSEQRSKSLRKTYQHNMVNITVDLGDGAAIEIRETLEPPSMPVEALTEGNDNG